MAAFRGARNNKDAEANMDDRNQGMKKQHTMKCFLVLLLSLAVISTACAFSANKAPVSEAELRQAVAVEPLAGVTADEAEDVRQAAEATLEFWREQSGLRLKQLPHIVLAKDRPAYRSEVMARFNISELEAARKTRGTDALTGKSFIVVNISGVPTPRQRTFLIAHEMTHQYQRQIAGTAAGRSMWLMEGMAEAAGAQVVARRGYWRLEQYRENWQTGLSRTPDKPTLGELETAEDWSNALVRYGAAITYKTAGLAALQLTQRFGRPAVWEYFSGLGREEPPETAFQGAFGIAMQDFKTSYTASLSEYRPAAGE